MFMAQDVIQVLTYKSVETILSTGGTQSWALDRNRARNCEFAVVCRNASTREAQGPEDHGSAFMVGRIKDVVPSTDTPGRWLITFSEYALVDWKDEWEGRNPVAYYRTDDYGETEDFSSLDFQPMPVMVVPAPSSPMTISRAKKELAESLGVSPDSIEIIVRG
tara:strand:+ start:75 stop:563 length:489 start_codon:yes stop_codon:yes gene_type:complete